MEQEVACMSETSVLIRENQKLRDENDKLRKELRWCKNELCLTCGDYKQSYLGACDGCRWYVMNEEVI